MASRMNQDVGGAMFSDRTVLVESRSARKTQGHRDAPNWHPIDSFTKNKTEG